MTYRDTGLEEALLKRGYDDHAATYVQNCLSFLEEAADQKVPPAYMSEAIDYYGRMLQGVDPATCDCCGKRLTNVKHREGLILGSECVAHPERYPCKSPAASTDVSPIPSNHAAVRLDPSHIIGGHGD